MKLLLIEDNPIWQTKLEMILHELNYAEIAISENLESARQYLVHTTPDLIIADIVLGEELIFDLFREEAYKNIPCLFVTSHEETQLYKLSKTIPDSFFLIKPFHKLTVLAAIENVLHHHKKLEKPNTLGIAVKGQYSEKIFLRPEQIIFIKSELNYCLIKTPKNQFLLKISLIQIKEHLGDSIIQIHKTYLVNKNYIENINLQKMQLETPCGLLPIGRLYKPHITNFMNEQIEL